MPGKGHLKGRGEDAHSGRRVGTRRCGQYKRRLRQVKLGCERLHFSVGHAVRVFEDAKRIAAEGRDGGLDEDID